MRQTLPQPTAALIKRLRNVASQLDGQVDQYPHGTVFYRAARERSAAVRDAITRLEQLGLLVEEMAPQMAGARDETAD